MRSFILSFIIVLMIATSCFAQNGLINEGQMAYPIVASYMTGDSFSDQELSYLDTSSNTIKKLITGAYKSREVTIKEGGSAQVRTTPCGTNEILVIAASYSSPNQTLYIYYIDNNNPENPTIINSGTLSFATSLAQTYYETIYVGDNTAYFFYMKTGNSSYCRPITNIKTAGGATLGDELLLFDSTIGYVGSTFYDPINDKILMGCNQISDNYCVISSPKSSPSVTTFGASFTASHTAGHILSIGNNKALYFYADNTYIFAECVINLDTTPATTSERVSKSMPNNLTKNYYKAAYSVYLGNNKGAVFVTESISPYTAWGVPFIIENDLVVFGDAVRIIDGTNGATVQWVSAVAIGSDNIAVLLTDTTGKLRLTYAYCLNNKLYTSSYGIIIYDQIVSYQCLLTYMGNNSLAAVTRGTDTDMILLNNIMPYYNTDITNINKYIVLGDYKTNEIALCKSLTRKSYSDNYSSYLHTSDALGTINKSLFIGPSNKYTPFRTALPMSMSINNIGNTYYPIMPPNDSAFGNKYMLDTVGTVLQKNLQNIKGF